MKAKTLNVYFIRHTEPLIDSGTCYGQLDCTVANDYEDQLEKISDYFNTIAISTIYSSPLQRCALLAQDLATKHIKSTVNYKDALKEINFGNWEGVKWDDIARSSIDEWNENRLHFQFPNGETPTLFYQRVLRAWHKLLSVHIDKPMDESIIIVTHAGVIRTILAELTALPLAESFMLKIDKASISQFVFHNSFSECVFINKTH